MKAATNLDDIFNAPVVTGGEDEGEDIFGGVAVRAASTESDFDAFEQEAAPEKKSRADVISEGIDRTPMMSVAAIRERFNKGKVPVFPKQIFAVSKRGAGDNGEADKSNYEILIVSNETPSSAAIAASSRVDEDSARPASPPSKSVLSEIDADNLTNEEFRALAELHECVEGLDFFSCPRNVDILIRPEQGGAVLVKPMELKFAAEQRLLVMIRKSATRYIRLNDVMRVDATTSCITPEFAPQGLPQETRGSHFIALYFVTTAFPMVIALKSLDEKEKLLKLTIFLRQLLKTETPLEICA